MIRSRIFYTVAVLATETGPVASSPAQHRNELDIVRAQNEQLAAELEEENAQLAEPSMSSVDRLLSISSKTRVVKWLIDHDESSTTIDLTATVEQLVETY